MKKEEIGRFYATSFDDKVIEFVVNNDHTIDCPTLHLYSFQRMELKPRFVMWNEKRYYTYNVPANHSSVQSQLIREYDIDDDLFQYLKDRDIIRYSNDMAYLYGFHDKKGYDSDPRYYGVGSPYKWAKKKGPILVKQKQGQFN